MEVVNRNCHINSDHVLNDAFYKIVHFNEDLFNIIKYIMLILSNQNLLNPLKQYQDMGLEIIAAR